MLSTIMTIVVIALMLAVVCISLSAVIDSQLRSRRVARGVETTPFHVEQYRAYSAPRRCSDPRCCGLDA